MVELSENKELLKLGNGCSSSGSESAPSEDNLNPTDLIKNLPALDKSLKQKLKQIETEKKSPLKQNKIVKKQSESPIKLNVSSPVKIIIKPASLNIKPVEVVQIAEETKIKKPKPEMKDAITQTDRSDLQIIKAKYFHNK